MHTTPILGVIADDFTGASDAASFLVQGGLQTLLYNGIPTESLQPDCQAVVIALKTRTLSTEQAVAQSLEAATYLLGLGIKQLYVKYCSTFDSTKKGNIGPVLDALLEVYQLPYTILCPALPVNGRIVFNGHLYVNGVPLHHSSMRNHPLTPMWDSSIVNLMAEQSKYPCIVGNYPLPGKLSQGKPPYYVIPNYTSTQDAEHIVKQFGHCKLLSGGSGLLQALASYHASHSMQASTPLVTTGKSLLLAGSCSQATLEQIAHFQKQGGASVRLDPNALLQGQETLDSLWQQVETFGDRPVLLYSSDKPTAVKKMQQVGAERISNLLEQTTANLAKRAVSHGYNRIIVAGGETSGAVTRALNFHAYRIGDSVAAGVPVMTPCNNTKVRLVLKSGNFGQPDFFSRAIAMTQEG